MKISSLTWGADLQSFLQAGPAILKVTNSLHLGKYNTMLTKLNTRPTLKDLEIWFE